MSQERRGSADNARVRAAARRIALLVGVSSALIIAVGITVLVLVIVATARPERGPGGERGDADHVVVDADQVVPWVIGFGVVAVVLLGVIAWVSAARAVRPLADALRLQREFVADASHELRTPLTALVSRIQILERRRERGDPIDEVIAKLGDDAASMGETLDELLVAASGEADAAAAGRHRSGAVGEGVTTAAERLAPLAEARGVRLSCDLGNAAQVHVGLATSELARACMVLIDNAIGHSPVGATVAVACRRSGAAVEIRVTDHGPGVAAADRDRIFERFARGSETGQRRGFGLGLALARDLARRAGGSVGVETSSPEGTVFLLRMPSV